MNNHDQDMSRYLAQAPLIKELSQLREENMKQQDMVDLYAAEAANSKRAMIEAQRMEQDLRAENERLKEAITELSLSGVELDDPRLRYVTVQVDRGAWDTITKNKANNDLSALIYENSLEVWETQFHAYEAALALKDTALDRLEWAGDDDTFDRCFACDVHKSKQHKPNCWWQAARKAGHE